MNPNKLSLTLLPDHLCIARLKPGGAVDISSPAGFFSVTYTDQEVSIVCSESQAPASAKVEKGWRVFRIDGELDFSLVGILSSIAKVLADHKISLFAISTYNTDYILVKKEDLENSVSCLQNAGYVVRIPQQK